MVKRLGALMFIFACTTFAWIVLGATIFSRTYSTDNALRHKVASTWGAPHEQGPPSGTYTVVTMHDAETTEGGKKVLRKVEHRETVTLPLERSRIRVGLDLEHRQKGLLWYATYKVGFEGEYTFRNSSDREQTVTFGFPFPASQAIYDDLTLEVDGVSLPLSLLKDSASVATRVPANARPVLRVTYSSQGLESWTYRLGTDVAQARDFQLTVRTNFHEIDFADNTLSPTERREQGDGWELDWSYTNLLSGFQIGLPMPKKLQPGPLAGRISFFAPVSLLFFFFLMFIITTLREIDLHPMNYFFLAAAFFSFHLLLACLVDHISIHGAFVICSAVSIFLVVSYLRLVVGPRFAIVEAGLTQLVYLVLFSYAFFFEGLTGLAITIGSILTLFVVMQMTGRIRWAERFARKPV
jgi:inner membrane protein involved in colicin E2 resistance